MFAFVCFGVCRILMVNRKRGSWVHLAVLNFVLAGSSSIGFFGLGVEHKLDNGVVLLASLYFWRGFLCD